MYRSIIVVSYATGSRTSTVTLFGCAAGGDLFDLVDVADALPVLPRLPRRDPVRDPDNRRFTINDIWH